MICEERNLLDEIKRVSMRYVAMEHCAASLLTDLTTKVFFWEVCKDFTIGKFTYKISLPKDVIMRDEFLAMYQHSKPINTTDELGSPTLVLYVKMQ